MPNDTSKPFYGEFIDDLKGEFINDAQPRPTFKLLSQFRFVDPNGLKWQVPAHTIVDGASIPKPFWSFIGGPFAGPYLNASVIHDHYCEEKSRTEHDTHRVFYYGMLAADVDAWRAKFMYWAVATFGPKWILTQAEVYSADSVRSGSIRSSGNIPEMPRSASPMVVNSLPTVDLEDPEVLAAVLSKAASVARTLKSSNGEYLDISSSGLVPADLESIEENSVHYTETFGSRDYRRDPDQLGVLSRLEVPTLDGVTPWSSSTMPQFESAPMLDPSAEASFDAAGDTADYFRLSPAPRDRSES